MQNARAVSKPRITPHWTLCVARLKAAPAAVRAHCDRCNYNVEVDLDVVQARHGELFSFWNRRPPCPARDPGDRRCPGRLTFAAQRVDSGMWPTLMKTEYAAETDAAHHAWRAEQEAVRRADAVWRFLRKRQLHRRRVRAEAAKLMMLPRDARVETVDIMLTTQRSELSFWAEVRLEVVRRLKAAERLDLDGEVDVRPAPGSRSRTDP